MNPAKRFDDACNENAASSKEMLQALERLNHALTKGYDLESEECMTAMEALEKANKRAKDANEEFKVAADLYEKYLNSYTILINGVEVFTGVRTSESTMD